MIFKSDELTELSDFTKNRPFDQLETGIAQN